jgi:hypothetical protein
MNHQVEQPRDLGLKAEFGFAVSLVFGAVLLGHVFQFS